MIKVENDVVLEQLEFDFVKEPPKNTSKTILGFGKRPTRVALTRGWGSDDIISFKWVSDEYDAYDYIRFHAKGLPGYREYPWTMTFFESKNFAIIDFGSWTIFGRIDYDV